MRNAALSILLAIALSACTGSGGSLSREDAQRAAEAFMHGTIVNSVSSTDIAGLYEVVINLEGKTGILYMDSRGKRIMTGFMFDSATGANLTQERLYDINRVDFSSIPLDGSVTMGNPAKGSKRVVVFTSPECDLCKVLHQEMKVVTRQLSDVVFIMKVVPINAKNPHSYENVRSIACAKNNDEALMRLEGAYLNKTIPSPDCETSAVEGDISLVNKLSISVLPAMIFEDGTKVGGALRTEKEIREMIEKHSRTK